MSASNHPRRAVLQVGGELFLELFRAGPRRVEYSVVDHPMPADGKIVGATYDAFRDVVELVIESATFAEVPPSGVLAAIDSPLCAVIEHEAQHKDGTRPL